MIDFTGLPTRKRPTQARMAARLRFSTTESNICSSATKAMLEAHAPKTPPGGTL